ncbi:MAG: hypothetical protein ABSH16_09700 [Sedimentisphaerales bacterium]
MRNIKQLHFAAIGIAAVLSLSAYAATYSGGSGTAGDPYLISNAADLNTLGATSADWSKCFKLTADINLSAYTGTQYKIIGNSTPQFTGSFDGDGHIIRNLTYTTTAATSYVGLFGDTNGASIKNLGLEDVNIYAGGGRTGCLAGEQDYGTITSCYSTGSVNSNSASSYAYTGGLVGYQFRGAITSSYSSSSVICTAKSPAISGGLVGWLDDSSITSSCSTGNIVATSTSTNAYAGGLVGTTTPYDGFGNISSCYSKGNVVSVSYGPSGTTVDVFAGGLVAVCEANVVNCYSTGQVSAAGNHLVFKGGLIAFKDGTVTASFWDVNTSGLTTSTGGMGLTTAEMKTLSTFTSVGWDFTNETVNGTADVWRMCTDGVYYPRLSWQSLDGDLACPDSVNFVDFTYFADRWLESDCASSNNFCGGADMDTSGAVDIADLAIFSENWLSVVWVCPDNANFVDFAYFAGQWRQTGCSLSNNFCGGADMDFSGTVDIADLAIFADNWLDGI